jgi:hypothetical protein
VKGEQGQREAVQQGGQPGGEEKAGPPELLPRPVVEGGLQGGLQLVQVEDGVLVDKVLQQEVLLKEVREGEG